MAKKDKKSILIYLPIIFGIVAIILFALPFLKTTIEVSALGVTTKTSVTMTGYSLAFALGKVKTVVTSSIKDASSTTVATIEDMKAVTMTLFSFIAYVIATIFAIIAAMGPKMLRKLSSLIVIVAFVLGIVFALLSKTSLEATNEALYKLSFKDAKVTFGICFSSTCAILGTVTSALALRK